ncbi:hypothetical protein IPZ70_15850 [Streptomyces polychromogenes]|nr:hypothetical protein [Streptomyces polychromogenes]
MGADPRTAHGAGSVPRRLADQINRVHGTTLSGSTAPGGSDLWGPGPAAGRSAAPPEALAERERAAAQVVTTGDVVRAALERVLKA